MAETKRTQGNTSGNRKKSSGSSRNTSSTRNSRSSRSPKASGSSQRFQNDIILLVILAACLILLVSVLGFGGIVGNVIANWMFGVMGLLAYAFPVLLFIGLAFIVSNHTSFIAFRKVLAGIILLCAVCGFLQLVTEGYNVSNTLMDYFTLSSDYRTGGGLIGGAVCFSTAQAFGRIGGMIIIVLVILVCLIIITQRSFFDFIFRIVDRISEGIGGAVDNYREGAPERERIRELRAEQQAIRREERRQERLRREEERLALLSEEGDDDEYEIELPDENRKTGRKTSATDKKQKKTGGFLDGSSLRTETEDNRSTTVKSAKKEKEQDYRQRSLFEDDFHIENGNSAGNDLFHDLEDDDLFGEEAKASTVRTVRSASGRTEAKRQETRPQADVSNDYNDDDAGFPPIEAGSFPEGLDASGPVKNAQNTGSTAKTTDVPAEESPRQRQSVKNPKSSQAEIENGIDSVQKQISKEQAVPKRVYHFPPLRLLEKGEGGKHGDSEAEIRATAHKLQETLYNFGVNAKVTNVSCGPTVTRFELQPEMGVKVSKIVSLADDIKLNLATADIRIEAPIPGKAAVGIEVPNKENTTVKLRELIESKEFKESKSRLSFAVGKDIGGKPVVTNIAKMPHLLIAGATGSGKSVCINTLIISLLYKASPDEVKLIMIDPKVVELSVYNGIPHLLIPVVTDPKKAAGALNWAVAEMTKRYNTFAEYNVRNLGEYTRKIESLETPEGENPHEKMPQNVIIVDELADLMMVAPGEVEDAICRLAQLARAAGIHLVIATQRPSVNVITGLIKANMPSRIAFAVSSGVDSRTILDMNGAEKLLGKGDMLFYPQGYPKPARLQGAFVSDEEVSAIVDYLTDKNPKAEYDSGIEQQLNSAGAPGAFGGGEDRDVYFEEAGKFIIEKDKASIGMLQRMFKIGFNRAARIMDQLSDAGVVGPEEGTKPRKILMTMEQFENYLEENG